MLPADLGRSETAGLIFARPQPGVLVVNIAGAWTHESRQPSPAAVALELARLPRAQRVEFDTVQLGKWDSGLLVFLMNVFDRCATAGVVVDQQRLPAGIRRLLELATAVPEQQGARRESQHVPFLARVGDLTERKVEAKMDALTFLGEVQAALIQMLRGKARFRRSDLIQAVHECGVQALGIVSLISVLVGVIFAFVGSIQLRMFGAQIYVADMVGIAMLREMAAVMTGIIVAGRTGAAFAARLGAMQANEEIDSLKTMGLSPVEFLVLPRLIALFLMTPLLCLYADLMGVLGGLIVGVTTLDIGLAQYYLQTRAGVRLNDLWVGLFSSAVFGVLVGVAGCLRGLQCGRSTSSVGEATTSAVVTGIVSITVATAVITIVCDTLGI